MGTHVFQLCLSSDIPIHADKHSRLGRLSRRKEFHGLLCQKASTNSLTYCDVEESLWCNESNDHPTTLEEKARDESVACGGYVEVRSGPYTYDHGTEAEGEDPKRGPLFWFSNPQKWRIVFRLLHPFYFSNRVCDQLLSTAERFARVQHETTSNHLYVSLLYALCQWLTFAFADSSIQNDKRLSIKLPGADPWKTSASRFQFARLN